TLPPRSTPLPYTTLFRSDRLQERGPDALDVADDAVVGDLEDGRVGVLVHGHDHLRAVHAREVLHRARDAERHVELGRDGLAGLRSEEHTSELQSRENLVC